MVDSSDQKGFLVNCPRSKVLKSKSRIWSGVMQDFGRLVIGEMVESLGVWGVGTQFSRISIAKYGAHPPARDHFPQFRTLVRNPIPFLGHKSTLYMMDLWPRIDMGFLPIGRNWGTNSLTKLYNRMEISPKGDIGPNLPTSQPPNFPTSQLSTSDFQTFDFQTFD